MCRYLPLVITIFSAFSLTNAVEAKAWRGIVPLKSTRADVERLLGTPGKHGRYQFDEERASISYAGGGVCEPVNGCLCLVSKDVVISVYVQLEVEMRFSTLNIDRKKYTKKVSPEYPTIGSYSNDEEGIIYTVDEKNDEVTAIEYLPTSQDCQEVVSRAKIAALFPTTSSTHPGDVAHQLVSTVFPAWYRVRNR